jgi:hypothetical protein
MDSRLIVVTGASANHERSLAQFLRSLATHKVASGDGDVYVWDFGLTEEGRRGLLAAFPWIVMKTFDFAAYPAFFDIRVNAGEYAWKPAAILETARLVGDRGLLLWCDAGNMVTRPLSEEKRIVLRDGIYSPISAGTVQQWTHPGTLDYLMISDQDPMLDKSPRNGAIFGFNLNDASVRRFLEEFAGLCRIRECIAPAGSNRGNHRQDQAVFTILFYRYFQHRGMDPDKHQYALTTHNDCD